MNYHTDNICKLSLNNNIHYENFSVEFRNILENINYPMKATQSTSEVIYLKAV